MARPVLNMDKPPDIPQRPMGRIPVVVRLVRPDGEEWWPATANRWTDTHVLVHWVEDEQAQDHRYELAWLRAEDVRRFLKTTDGGLPGELDGASQWTRTHVYVVRRTRKRRTFTYFARSPSDTPQRRGASRHVLHACTSVLGRTSS